MTQRLIDKASREALKQKFAQELQDDVQLSVFVGDENQEYGEFTVKLVQELSELDSRIKYSIHENGNPVADELGVTSRPTVLIGWDQGYRIKYTGAPAGHEASGFIETITMVSRGDSGLQAGTVEKLAQVDKDVTIQVFVTPTCPQCPRSVLLANQIAVATKGRVTAECVEASQNMELARQFNVSSVPQQVLDGDLSTVTIGGQPEQSFVDSVLVRGASRYEEIVAEEAARRALAEKLVDEPTGTLVLTDGNFDEAVAKYPNLVVDCWAEWCAPCRMVGPIIDELAQDYAGQIVFGKVDVDSNPGISQRFQVSSIPTLMFFKGGEKVGNQVGALPKSQIEEALKNHQLA